MVALIPVTGSPSAGDLLTGPLKNIGLYRPAGTRVVVVVSHEMQQDEHIDATIQSRGIITPDGATSRFSHVLEMRPFKLRSRA